MLLNSCAHLFYYKITLRGYKRGKHRGKHYEKEPSKITNDLPLVLHLPEGLRPSAVIVAGCDLLYLLPFFFLFHYIWINTPAPVLPLAQVLQQKWAQTSLGTNFITDLFRPYWFCVWATCPVKERKATFEGVLFVCFRLLPAHLPRVLGTVWPKSCFIAIILPWHEPD